MARPTFTYPLRTARAVASGFYSQRAWGQHAALDYPVPNGSECLASAPGRVVTAGWLGDGGLSVELEHPMPDGAIWRTRYMHLQMLLVGRGQLVAREQLIARTDNTGTSSGPHLHFAIWVNRLIEALQVQRDPVLVYGWWALDPLRLLTEEDWFDMATKADLKAVVLDVVRSEEYANIIKAHQSAYVCRKKNTGSTWLLTLGGDSSQPLTKHRLPGPIVTGYLKGNWDQPVIVEDTWLDAIPTGGDVPGLPA